MCGRYASARSTADLATLFGADDQTNGELIEPDFNVAPTTPVPAVLVRHDERRLVTLRWGLVPSWAKDARIGSRLINARVETLAEKPAFRSALERRRCLLPADGFYEWMPSVSGTGPKQPFFLAPADGSLLPMAGLYEIWRDAAGALLWTATVITTEAADDVGHIHDRAPMTVAPDDWARWLAPETEAPLDALRPSVEGALRAVPVSTLVNNVRNNGPELLAPV